MITVNAASSLISTSTYWLFVISIRPSFLRVILSTTISEKPHSPIITLLKSPAIAADKLVPVPLVKFLGTKVETPVCKPLIKLQTHEII